MASSTSLLSFVFTLFYLFLFASSSESNKPTTITIPLTSTFPAKRSTEPFVFLQQLANASKARAHYLKQGNTNPRIKKSLFPQDIGVHTATFSFGTPPQKLSYLVDTGSHVVWAPCAGLYTCKNCSISADKVPKYNPKLSSSSKIMDCRHPKCLDGCLPCDVNSKNCSRTCTFSIQYGTGAESGLVYLENLVFPPKTFQKFAFGCTTLATEESISDGIAGFGRSAVSMPMQMGVKKFAYCLNSHDFDGTKNTGKLIFDYSDAETPGLSYTSFLKNPPLSSIYYYLDVKYMALGNKVLQIPRKYLAPGPDGNGGVIIDSGTSYGEMVEAVFKIVTDELKKQMSMYPRALDAEKSSGFTPCYNSTGHKSIKIPKLIYHFRGGATMVVPGQNYVISDTESPVACFSFARSPDGSLGSSITLGNNQHTDYYVEYDLKNDRLGFRPQTC